MILHSHEPKVRDALHLSQMINTRILDWHLLIIIVDDLIPPGVEFLRVNVHLFSEEDLASQLVERFVQFLIFVLQLAIFEIMVVVDLCNSRVNVAQCHEHRFYRVVQACYSVGKSQSPESFVRHINTL